ncbi:MAG: hypothetical protein ACYSWU_28910 [Planctomycetota bacterium]
MTEPRVGQPPYSGSFGGYSSGSPLSACRFARPGRLGYDGGGGAPSGVPVAAAGGRGDCQLALL